MDSKFLIFFLKFFFVFVGVVLTPTPPSPSLSAWGNIPHEAKINIINNLTLSIMANLHFIDLQTVEQFKADNHVTQISVKKNSETNKLFFTYGGKTGSVAIKGVPQKPMISLVHPTSDEEPTEEEKKYIGKSIKVGDKAEAHPKANGYFYLLHEEGDGGAPTLATF